MINAFIRLKSRSTAEKDYCFTTAVFSLPAYLQNNFRSNKAKAASENVISNIFPATVTSDIVDLGGLINVSVTIRLFPEVFIISFIHAFLFGTLNSTIDPSLSTITILFDRKSEHFALIEVILSSRMLTGLESSSNEFGSNRRLCFERINLPPRQAKGSLGVFLKLHLLSLITRSGS